VPQASQLSPELGRSLLQLARALLVAARNWSLYPPEHPTVAVSVSRLGDAIHESSLGAIFSIGITPDTLMIEGAAADGSQTGIGEAAALLHDRDLLTLTFVGDVPDEALQAFLRILTLDAAERRARGGPAKIWLAESGHPSILMEQIDYEHLLAREEGDVPEPARRDDLWRSIVMSIAGGQQTVFDERAQERLLAIAGSAPDIADLAKAVMAPKCAIDGSPMITSQAATVLAAFRHLNSIVSVMSRERLPEVMNNIAAAATQLDAHVMMQVMQAEDEAGDAPALVRGLAGAFDDTKVAQLLATALALDGKASDRLATIFNTIAPDEDRKRRVLTMTRNMLSETDFGKRGQFQVLWTSMEELLVSYDDKPFVSEVYKTALDGVGARAERMAAVDLPPELNDWMDSLGQANVRSLSVRLLIDLLTIERDETHAAQIAEDMEALAEDLLMSGAYADALTVTEALSARADTAGGMGRDACRHALDRLGDSLAMRETAALIGDVDEGDWAAIKAVITAIGPPSVESLKPVVIAEQDTPATERAEGMIVGFGAPSVTRIAPLVSDARWFAQRRGARMLGTIATKETVPLLQPLLRNSDARVVQAAVEALCQIRDPGAARAIQTLLRAATGEIRHAVIDTMVAGRDARVVPMLAQIVGESEPLGKDHDVVLDTIAALGKIASDSALPTLVSMATRKKFFGGKKLRALKERSVASLIEIGSPKADEALRDAAATGDRGLKKAVAASGWKAKGEGRQG
jgi:HEAT repeat protein